MKTFQLTTFDPLSSPFKAIQRFDEQGNGFWYSVELLELLGMRLQTHNSILTTEQTALLILEAAAQKTLETYLGSALDAFWLHIQAANIYNMGEGQQSAAALFNAVLSNIMRDGSIGRASKHQLLPIIKKYWRSITDLDGNLVDGSGQGTVKHRPDFFLETGDKKYPVYVRPYNYSTADVKKLKGYIRAFKSEKGIAVAPGFAVKQPSNIELVKIDMEKALELEGYTRLSHIIENRVKEFV